MILKYPLFLLFLGASLAPRVAAAQPAADASRQPRVVLLDEAAPMAPSFRDTLRELLGRLSLSLASSPGPVKVLARVRVETRPGAVAVLVARGDGSPFVLREVPAGDSIAVLSETVAHVILGAVEALVSEPEAVPPAPAPPAAPPAAPSAAPPAAPEPAPPAPAPPGSPSRGPLLALEARGLLARPDALVPGLAGRIGVGAPWALRPRLFVEGAWMSFREVRQRSIEAGVGAQALRGGLQIDAMRGAWWALTSSLRVGADRYDVTKLEAPSSARVSPSARWQPTVGASIGARLRVAPSLSIVADLGADVDLAPHRWLVLAGPERLELFSPARVRPFAALGLELPLSLSGGDP